MPEYNLGGHGYVLAAKRNYFINPATLEAYPWTINHQPTGDEGTEKKRSVQTSGLTSNIGLVRQQAPDEPMILKRAGEILDLTQEKEMWRWFQICKAQTIYFLEFNGDAYEVQITDFKVQRVGTGGPTRSGQPYYAKYTLEMEVYSVLRGILQEAGITP
jgi:hypothetical protein